MKKDLLSGNELFRSVPAPLVQEIIEAARERAVADGEVLIRQGERGDLFYVVLSGTVRLHLSTEEGVESVLGDLGAGDSFGETVLLTGEPHPVSVRALGPSRLLVVPRAAFERLITTVPEFPLVLARRLSRRLSRATSDLARAADTEKAYQRFVTQQGGGNIMELVGRSEYARKLQAAIGEVAPGTAPVLAQGPAGTEMEAVAWAVHRAGRPADAPFLVMDAQTVTFTRAGLSSDPRHPFQLELAQDYALFGLRPGGLQLGAGHALGLLQVGHGGTVVIANVESLAECVQARLAEFIRDGSFLPFGALESVTSTVRIIALTTADLPALVTAGRFSSLLHTQLAANTLTLTALNQRKKDLPLMFEALIAQCARQASKDVSGLDQQSLNHLLAYDWPGNTDELLVVIRRAVSLARGKQVELEDILIGPASAAGPAFNLLSLEPLRALLRHRAYPGVLQLVAGGFFVLILYLGFFAKVAPEENLALPLAWATWEPLIFWGTLVAARAWCAVCPIGGASAFITRHVGLRRPIPHLLRQYGIYFAAAGFGVIIWLQVVTGMPRSPRATALLVLWILVPALVLSLVYQRRAWCRFLCPLGSMNGYLSSASCVELRCNTSTCNNECKTHVCYRGDGAADGCPMFEAPFSLHANQNCTLCCACIKACTHSAPVLNLRPPGRELWTAEKPIRAVVVLVPVIAGSQIFRGLAAAGLMPAAGALTAARWAAAGLVLVSAALAIYLLLRLMGGYVFRAVSMSLAERAGFVAHAFVPLTVGFELAYQLERILVGTGHLLTLVAHTAGFAGTSFGPMAAPWAMKLAQALLCLAGGAGALAVSGALTRRTWAGTGSGTRALPPLWYGPILLLTAVYARLLLAASA